MRSELHRLLSHVVSARLEIESLQHLIVHEMQLGNRPTYRGHEWGKEQIDLLSEVGYTVDKAFHLLKALQWPEMLESRLEDIRELPL